MEKQNILNSNDGLREGVKGTVVETVTETGARKMSKRRLALLFLRCAAACVLTFLFTTKRMLFEAAPLGFALLAAAGGEAPFAALGILGASLEGATFTPSLALGGMLILVSRTLSSIFLDTTDRGIRNRGEKVKKSSSLDALFCESVYLRVMSGAIGVFFVGVWRIIEGGFRFYDLFASIFYLVLTPVATILFCGCFSLRERKEREGRALTLMPREKIYYRLSLLSILSALTFSLDMMSFVGISLPLFFAIFFTLLFCRYGALWGIFSGLLLGLSVGATYAPMLAFCAASYLFVSKISRIGGAISVSAIGVAFGLYANGIGTLASDLPALISASSVFFVADRIELFDDIKRLVENGNAVSSRDFEEAIVSGQRANLQDERLRSISDSFSSLSEIFYNLSSKLRRPTMLDLRSICEENFDAFCEGCPNKETCFGTEYAATLDVMKTVTVQLHSRGEVEVKKLPDSFKKRCHEHERLASEINHACSVATKRAFLNEKTEIFALDYDAIAQILNEAIAENESEFKIDNKLSKRLSRAIADEGYGEHRVMAFGKRKLRIIARGLDLSQRGRDISSLMKRLEEITGLSLCEPTFELAFGSVNMQTESQVAFTAELAYSLAACEGESVCGDAVSGFENGEGYLYALISDGMGTGRAAALASETCNVFLRKMLSAGNRLEPTLRMLNSVLRARGSRSEDECSATVDLLRLDLYSGELTLVKSGAAPTFVLRGENVIKLASPSLPIGILRAPDSKQMSLNCEDGDLVVMLSDGAMKNGDDCTYITKLLSEKKIARMSTQEIADKIIERVRAEGDVPSDDVSAVVVRVNREVS